MGMVEVKVNGLALDMATNSPVVILSDLESERLLPIWIGHYEAWAIAMELSGLSSKRPLTHDLIKLAVELMDGKVEKVEVTKLVEQTFYAEIHIKRGDSVLKLDARPSDSMALALKCQAKVFVAEELFQVKTEEMGGKKLGDAESLKERLKKINPEDFGKYSL